ncbi:MAG TPA: gliding motility-associated C-terminal domain-containing protein, partial [Panacibacter sp.]|nr:gliding motility-associated C-terminal domain-containing protein [Panacibacter sp.]
TAFTPNRDGRNDYLYPLSAYRTSNLEFKIFNKFGRQLFAGKDAASKWDGTFNGILQPPGVYVWFLHYTDTDTGKTVFKKGTSVLIR